MVFIPKDQHGHQFVLDAKAKEYQKFIDNKAFEEVPNLGQKYITMSWIITQKLYGNGETRCKAHAVVNGNQLDQPVPRESPTARKNILHKPFPQKMDIGIVAHASKSKCRANSPMK